MSNVEQIFKYPKPEIIRMEKDYKRLFGNKMAQFIEQEAHVISAAYHDQCAHILVDRFIEINKVVQSVPENPSKKQYDQIVQQILSLAEPSAIANEIQRVVNNSDVYEYYKYFIEKSDKDVFHQLYVKCAFTKEATINLNQLAMGQMKSSIDDLSEYIKSLQAHNQLINSIQERRKGDSFIKTGASIVGLGLGIPFLGMGLGALIGAGDKKKIQESLGNIFNHIDFLEESLYETVDKLGDSLYLLFLTLIGGTFIAVNHTLNTQNLRIEQMNDEHIVTYALTPEEKTKFEKWFHVSITGITQLVKEKRWSEAIRIVKEMHQMIADTPIHSQYEIEPNKSALYIAHVYYYAIYQEALLEEYRAGHIDSFLTQSKAFWDTLILYPLEKDFPSFASHPAHFIFLYVKQYMHRYPNELYWMNKSVEYISKRRENNILLGEYGENTTDYAQNVMIYFLMTEFYNDVMKLKTRRNDIKVKEFNYKQITNEQVEHLIAIDNALNHPDALTKFLHSIKDRQKKEKRVPFIRWSIRIAAAAILLIFLVMVSNPIMGMLDDAKNSAGEKISESTTFIGDKWESVKLNVSSLWSSLFEDEENNEVTTFPKQVIITEPAVNIRDKPSLDGYVIVTGYMDEFYNYLNEEQTDATGVTWLTIQLSDGRIAYVSKKVATIQ